VIGTIAYMSPEQAQGKRVGPASDVYSAGMVLYELLAGAPPLRGATPAATLSTVAAARLPSPATLRPAPPGGPGALVDAARGPRHPGRDALQRGRGAAAAAGDAAARPAGRPRHAGGRRLRAAPVRAAHAGVPQ